MSGSSLAHAHRKGLPIPRVLRRLFAELTIADRERRGSDFTDVRAWPDRIAGFEDLAFLFSSTILAHGIASLRFDEAAYLYRLVREAQPQTIVEIGRFRGGSTFVFAAALETGIVHSYDIATRQGRSGAELDRRLADAIERYGLSERAQLHVEDSRIASPPAAAIDVLFVDGDHREESVWADIRHWTPLVRPGGHVLLHDAVDAPDFAPPWAPGPARVAARIDGELERREAAGSLAHFVRR